jgi:formate dehydrogenase iron-sulfur subunit
MPVSVPKEGEQYAFEVDLDKCSGCKACVAACHSLNGLDETETWRSVGLLISPSTPGHTTRKTAPVAQVQVTTACHHCVDPACLNGCPVLAYEKDPITGIVRHLDDQCIGCQYCIMKCPYEVPKYSSRLGIVRKCDLCANRLAVGEAPACAQACPNEAIRVTVVERDDVTARFRTGPAVSAGAEGEGVTSLIPGERIRTKFPQNLFLPDSPDPALTLPTTRYVSRNPVLADLVAADYAALRLEPPHWPLVIMLVLTQSAAGLLVAASLLGRTAAHPFPLTVTGLGLLVAGLATATLHLGQPLKAWRSFLGWRKSWLSREVIALNGFAAAAGAAVFMGKLVPLAALLGLVGVFTSAMVYVDTGRALWNARLAFCNFFGTALLLGATCAALVLSWIGNVNLAQPFALAALVIRTALFLWRRLELDAALRDDQSPLHFNARVIRELLPWMMSAHTALFIAATLSGLLALSNGADLAPVWASVTALTTFGSEIIGRYVFFAASASKRMPGGVAA